MIDKYLIAPGFTFTGKVNGARMRITKIENGMAHIQEVKTEKVFLYGVKALEHLQIEE